MHIKVLLLAAAVGLSAGSASNAMAATLVTDGDFSDPSVGLYASFGAGQSASTFGPWTVTSGNVDLIGSYWQSASLGGGSVDLDGYVPGTIQQSFVAGPGDYLLKFFLSGNPDTGPGLKSLNVSVGGASQGFSFTTGANDHENMMYVPETLAFQSAGGTDLLTFASLDSLTSTSGAVISGVTISEVVALSVPDRVSAVPLPAALPLLGTALAGLIGYARRRKSKGITHPG